MSIVLRLLVFAYGNSKLNFNIIKPAKINKHLLVNLDTLRNERSDIIMKIAGRQAAAQSGQPRYVSSSLNFFFALKLPLLI